MYMRKTNLKNLIVGVYTEDTPPCPHPQGIEWGCTPAHRVH